MSKPKVVFRSCWNCNSAHSSWKDDKDNVIIVCFAGCEKVYVNGKQFDTVAEAAESIRNEEK